MFPQDYVVAVVVPNGEHFNELTGNKGELAKACKEKKYAALAQKAIADYGVKNGLEKFELPSKVILTTDEWTPDNGLVTAAFKIRRREIVDKYKADIDNIYT